MAAADNLYTMFRDAAARYGKSDALASRRNGVWRKISHDELVRRVRYLSAGLHTIGIGRGDRVAIFAESRPEWTLVDLATLGVGATLVPVYPTVTAEQAAYVIRDSGARLVVLSGQSLLEKLLAELPGLPAVERVVAFDPVSAPEGVRVESLDEIEALGAELVQIDPEYPERLAAEIRPDDVASLIYTSGTTGNPKGVILTHANLLSNVRGCFDDYEIFDSSDVALSFLPLSHVLERTGVYAYLHSGVSVYFAGSIDTLPGDLADVHPTVMISVPRLYEKVLAKITSKGLAPGGVQALIFRQLMEAGSRWAVATHAGRSVDPVTYVLHLIADVLIYRKVREALGGRIRYLLSGGAPLMPEIAYAFLAAGVTIYEGYGLTETSPVIAFNRPGSYRIGTVGKVLGNLEVRIAPDGEILVRGPSVTPGYYKLPESTHESFDEEGFFRTGDIGHLEPDGFLVITDRKKDLIKTSGGKYVAPQPIENAIKVSGLFSQAIVIGDRRKFCSALLVPDPVALRLALAERGLEVEEAGLYDDPRVPKLVLEIVDELTPHLARYEKIKRVALLPHELTIESGELTPTLKVKRRVVEGRYRDTIDRLYADAEDRELVLHG
jgi:long-chain acyl-CoA synthetase